VEVPAPPQPANESADSLPADSPKEEADEAAHEAETIPTVETQEIAPDHAIVLQTPEPIVIPGVQTAGFGIDFDLDGPAIKRVLAYRNGSQECLLVSSSTRHEFFKEAFEYIRNRWPELPIMDVFRVVSFWAMRLFELKSGPYESEAMDIKDAAFKMLLNPDITEEIKQDFAKIGIVGEQNLALTLYLAGTSRLLDRPLACIIQAPSSSGKSFLASRVSDMFPADAVVQAHSMTPRAILYLEPGSLVRKLLIGGERSHHKDPDATRAFRELISDGYVSSIVGGRRIEQRGPVAYVESTTQGRIFGEDLNRCLLLTSDSSSEQTRRIIEYTGRLAQYGDNSDEKNRILSKHWIAQSMLRNCDVRIPFATRLTANFNTESVEARRSINQVLSMVKAVALLHQFQRIVEPRDDDYILACPEDYRIARSLLVEPLSRSGSGLTEAIKRYYHGLRDWEDRQQFTVKAASRRGGDVNDDSTIRKYLGKLVDASLVRIVGKRGKAPVYQVVQVFDDADEVCGLPAVDVIDDPELRKVILKRMPVTRYVVPEKPKPGDKVEVGYWAESLLDAVPAEVEADR
jgi:hypothetical protein